MNTYATWFGRVVWLGIFANFAIAIPSLIMPGETLVLFSFPSAYPLLWVTVSALFLILLSLFYIPAARHPLRYLPVSWLTVLARLVGVVFFLGFNRDYYTLGLFDLIFFIPEAILLSLAVMTPVSPYLITKTSPTVRLRLVAIGLLLLAVGGGVTYFQFFRTLPPTYFASDEEHFLYGSIGTESTSGVPYWIWLVLPRIFPDKLPRPGGYAALGMIFAEGRELPVGFSKQTIGVDRVAINCAICHSATYRKNPLEKPVIVAGGPGSTQNPQAYLHFLIDCARDPRFTSSIIMAEIAKNYRLSFLDRLTYRFVLVPFVKYTLLAQKNEYASYGLLQNLTTAGGGRIDPFNLVKYRYLKQPPDGSLGNSDMEPLWNLKAHAGYSFHWDGLNNSIQEVLLSSAIGDGTPLKWVDRDWKKNEKESSLKRILNFINNNQAPKYPFPIDQALAAKGKATYDQQCAQCHAPGGARTGKVEPIENPMLATDRNRIDMWTQSSATAYNQYTSRFDWRFTHFGKQLGYVNVTLDGLWLRAPYLHNGSVPNLVELLKEPTQRPKIFYRDYDVLDPQNVGFISEGPEAEQAGSRFDVNERGNSNAGHLWGTKLGDEEKKQLVEYLKTL
jgi:processive rubber oxygenase RoxA-like protein/cbb3-type cytochrome c oxidase subunit III